MGSAIGSEASPQCQVRPHSSSDEHDNEARDENVSPLIRVTTVQRMRVFRLQGGSREDG
jgi:hypothetical protein